MRHLVYRLVTLASMLFLASSLSAPHHAFASVHHSFFRQQSHMTTLHWVPQIPATKDIQPAWWNNKTGPNMPCDYTNYKNYTGVTPALLTSWRGIEVCGPAPTTDHPVQFIPNPNNTTELEFECPELVKRYLLLLYDLPSVQADGYQVVDAYTNVYPNLLKKITPSMHIFPSVGDVLSYGTTNPGHTSIVTAVKNKDKTTGTADVTVIEQNIQGLAKGTETMHMTNWQMSGMGGTVAEWMTFKTWQITSNPSISGDQVELEGVAAVSSNDAWAVGYQQFYPSTFQTLTEHWNGKQWSVIPSPSPYHPYLAAVAAVSSNDVWAVGTYGLSKTLTEHWNGSLWSVVPSPNFSGEDVLDWVSVVNSTDIWAVGISYYQNGDSQTLTEHWDGSQWKIISSPNGALEGVNYLYSVTAIASNDVWTIGNYLNSTTNTYDTLTEHWDGSQWSIIPSPNQGTGNNYLNSIAAVSSKDVWAVGIYTDPVSAQYRTLSMHWDGLQWSIIPSPNQGTNNYLSAVAARATDDVWTVGTYPSPGNNKPVTLVLHWDGRQWNTIPSPNQPSATDNEFFGIALTTSLEAWAVGRGFNVNTKQPLIEHFS